MKRHEVAVNTTDLEIDVLRVLTESEYDEGVMWSDMIADYTETATKRQIPGIVSSLVQKGLVTSSREAVYMTPLGKQVWLMRDKR